MYKHTFTHIHPYTYKYTYVHIHACMHIHTSICTYIFDWRGRVSCVGRGMLTLSGAPGATSLVGYYHLSVFGL